MESKGKLYRQLSDHKLLMTAVICNQIKMSQHLCCSNSNAFVCCTYLTFSCQRFFLKNNKTNKNKKGSITYNAHRREL